MIRRWDWFRECDIIVMFIVHAMQLCRAATTVRNSRPVNWPVTKNLWRLCAGGIPEVLREHKGFSQPGCRQCPKWHSCPSCPRPASERVPLHDLASQRVPLHDPASQGVVLHNLASERVGLHDPASQNDWLAGQTTLHRNCWPKKGASSWEFSSYPTQKEQLISQPLMYVFLFVCILYIYIYLCLYSRMCTICVLYVQHVFYTCIQHACYLHYIDTRLVCV